jgi:hypothetical protein
MVFHSSRNTYGLVSIASNWYVVFETHLRLGDRGKVVPSHLGNHVRTCDQEIRFD